MEKMPTLEGEVECDEVYVIALKSSHKPSKKGAKRTSSPFKNQTGTGDIGQGKATDVGDDSTWGRGGPPDAVQCVLQATIAPLIKNTIALGTLIYTDEYSIYARLVEWGYQHKSVCHAKGEYARDEDGDGFCEVHVNTMEGFWSLLRSWLRPHRGISQEKLPLYLGFFEFVHNARKRG